jgi:hypothetical protein
MPVAVRASFLDAGLLLSEPRVYECYTHPVIDRLNDQRVMDHQASVGEQMSMPLQFR